MMTLIRIFIHFSWMPYLFFCETEIFLCLRNRISNPSPLFVWILNAKNMKNCNIIHLNWLEFVVFIIFWIKKSVMHSAQKLGIRFEQTCSLSDYLQHYLNMIIFFGVHFSMRSSKVRFAKITSNKLKFGNLFEMMLKLQKKIFRNKIIHRMKNEPPQNI